MIKKGIKLLGTASLLLLVVYSCSEPDSSVIYRKEERKDMYNLDETSDWLFSHANFHDPKFYSVFNDYYDRQLKLGHLDKAATVLGALAEQEMYFSLFRESTLERIHHFRKHYESKVSWDQTLFVESYLGNYNLNQNEYRRALPYFRSLVTNKPFDYNTCVEVAHGYGDIAFCYFAMGEHEKALQNDLKALHWFDKTDNTTGKGGIYDNLALVSLYTKNYKDADAYFNKAMKSFKEANDTVNMFTCLHNKIILYQEMGHPDEYKLIDSTYRLFKESKLVDESMELSLSGFYMQILLREKRIPEAKEIINRMKVLTEEVNSPISDIEYLISLAEYEIGSGGGITDIPLIEKALEVVEEQEDYQNLVGFAEVLKNNAVLQKNYQRAYYYSEKLKRAENKISDQRIIAKTMELDKLYETKRKEEEIVLQKETIYNGKITIALLFSLVMVLILAGVIVFFRQKQKKIKRENKRSKQYTKRLLDKTEEERRRIASDLHDSVSHELLNLKHSLGENKGASGEKIDLIIKDIRSISRNLHPVMFEKVGLTASINQLLDRAQSVNQLMVTSDIVYCGSLSVSDELQVYRIVQEALSNIIKYAEAVAAKIIIREGPDDLMIQIKDNGTGFNVSETLSRKDAFGLHNIIQRSKAIGGVAKIHSDKNGTIITIDLKKTT
ncbi:MAG: tetratricopeptide repeat-containing sensor histidine kinase [Fluviicola sp.]